MREAWATRSTMRLLRSARDSMRETNAQMLLAAARGLLYRRSGRFVCSKRDGGGGSVGDFCTASSVLGSHLL